MESHYDEVNCTVLIQKETGVHHLCFGLVWEYGHYALLEDGQIPFNPIS